MSLMELVVVALLMVMEEEMALLGIEVEVRLMRKLILLVAIVVGEWEMLKCQFLVNFPQHGCLNLHWSKKDA